MSHSSYLTVLSPSILYKDCDKEHEESMCSKCGMIGRILYLAFLKKNIGGTDWILPNIIGSGIGYRAGYRVLHMGSCLSCLPDASLGGSVPLRTKTMGYRLGIAKYYRVSGIGYLSHMGLCLSCLSGRECASQYYPHPAPHSAPL